MENAIALNELENIAGEINRKAEEEIFGAKVGFITRVLGCWHRRMSRPVTTKNISYRFCPDCGIRRRYDLETFQSQGSFYYPGEQKDLHHV